VRCAQPGRHEFRDASPLPVHDDLRCDRNLPVQVDDLGGCRQPRPDTGDRVRVRGAFLEQIDGHEPSYLHRVPSASSRISSARSRIAAWGDCGEGQGLMLARRSLPICGSGLRSIRALARFGAESAVVGWMRRRRKPSGGAITGPIRRTSCIPTARGARGSSSVWAASKAKGGDASDKETRDSARTQAGSGRPSPSPGFDGAPALSAGPDETGRTTVVACGSRN
jgi:hypothetical protein